ncbi:MaoC/PaaZ C-terminal domain-containing protein [Nocardioides sp. LHD-245]|uniref:MaoC family dehydratase n=1 Tax=Nocardioides sp. LHD-245 TaxID=3051387 RepID=UPI0027E05950|nr:MaoC/PaaZ C-terminal domain-containing protein [Nocardioides sp. LHD-245]
MTVLASAERRFSQADLDGWAALSGDWNPLHTDAAYAAGTHFGQTITFGHLILTWLTSLAGRLTDDGTLAGTTITGLRFKAPVFTDRDYRVLALSGDQGIRLEVRDAEDDHLCSEAVLDLNGRGAA